VKRCRNSHYESNTAFSGGLCHPRVSETTPFKYGTLEAPELLHNMRQRLDIWPAPASADAELSELTKPPQMDAS
jgi:hypothetical protein